MSNCSINQKIKPSKRIILEHASQRLAHVMLDGQAIAEPFCIPTVAEFRAGTPLKDIQKALRDAGGYSIEQYDNSDCILAIQDNTLRLELCYANEGISGDYQPDNPHDKPYLRFYLYDVTDGKPEEIENSSYCTLIRADASKNKILLCARHIFDEYRRAFNNSNNKQSLKKLGEQLSWTSSDSL